MSVAAADTLRRVANLTLDVVLWALMILFVLFVVLLVVGDIFWPMKVNGA